MTEVFIIVRKDGKELKKELHLFEIDAISSKSWTFRNVIREFEAEILGEDVNGHPITESTQEKKNEQ